MLGRQKSGAHHPNAPKVVSVTGPVPPEGMLRKLIAETNGDEKVHRILPPTVSVICAGVSRMEHTHTKTRALKVVMNAIIT